MDENGSPLVSTNDGVSSKNGQIKWRWQGKFIGTTADYRYQESGGIADSLFDS